MLLDFEFKYFRENCNRLPNKMNPNQFSLFNFFFTAIQTDVP